MEGTDRQTPLPGEIFLDHVGHFVADVEAAQAALRQVGFAPTPRSVQVNPVEGGGYAPTGTGNVTAMLPRGYMEVLFKTADTPLGRQLDNALARYPGVHLAAFAVADAAGAHARLATAGFAMQPLVSMQRPVDTADGPGVAAFTVARVSPGVMPEGRIQILTHRTEQTVWQPRWLAHPNGAGALLDIVIAVSDLDEASGRFARFLDRPAAANAAGTAIRLDRGRVQLVGPDALAAMMPPIVPPGLPFMGAYAIAVRSLPALERHLRASAVAFTALPGALMVPFPPALGTGAWFFVEDPAALPWR